MIRDDYIMVHYLTKYTSMQILPDLTPSHCLAARMARWASSLDHDRDSLLWALLRFDDHVRAPGQHDLRLLHAHAQRMRNTVVPAMAPAQVLELDLLLERPTWRDADARIRPFAGTYLAHRTFGNRRGPIPWVRYARPEPLGAGLHQ